MAVQSIMVRSFIFNTNFEKVKKIILLLTFAVFFENN